MRLRLDFGAHAPVTLTPAAAERLALVSDVRPGTKEKPDRGVIVSMVGRKTVRISWSRETVSVEGVTQPLEVVTPLDYAAGGADGSIRPSALPCAIVRFAQRTGAPGDVETVLRPVTDGRFDGLAFRAKAGTQDMQVEFGPWRAQSVAQPQAGLSGPGCAARLRGLRTAPRRQSAGGALRRALILSMTLS